MEVVQAVAAGVLLVGNFFFVAVEFSIARARPTMVEKLVSDGVRGARSLQHAVEKIDSYLSACQLGITICSIGLGITAEPLVTAALEDAIGVDLGGIAAATLAFVLAYAIVSMFHVVLGELAPKSLAIARTSKTGLVLVPPMRIFYIATKPVVDLFNWLGNLVLRPFGIPPASEAGAEPHSEMELEALIAESQRRGLIDPEEQAFASGAFQFGDRRAREVMLPRHRVTTLSAEQTIRDAALAAAASGHRRLPLCEAGKGLDEAVGLINLSDLTRALARDDDVELRELARPLPDTSEATLLDELLEEMREQREHLTVVRDEHGTALGIITLEDIIEQVMGDIRDEFDPEPDTAIENVEAGRAVAGDTSVHFLALKLELEFGEHREATVGGYMVERLGHVPVVGEEVELGGATLRAEAVEGSRVAEVAVVRDGGRGAEAPGADGADQS